MLFIAALPRVRKAEPKNRHSQSETGNETTPTGVPHINENRFSRANREVGYINVREIFLLSRKF